MNAQDIEDVIREDFDDDMRKLYEDLSSGLIPVETTPADPKDKGKGQVGQKRKDAEGSSASLVKKKKRKAVTIVEPQEPTMTKDEYDLIAARIQEKMQEKFDAL